MVGNGSETELEAERMWQAQVQVQIRTVGHEFDDSTIRRFDV